MPEVDERFVAGALEELSQLLRTQPTELAITPKRLKDESELMKEIGAVLDKVGNESDAFLGCSLNIEKILPITANLLVYCVSNDPIAKAAIRESHQRARWGYTGDYVNYVRGALFAAVYKPDNKFIIWHEALHLLGADDCYDENNLYQKKPDCDFPDGIMQYAPTPKNVRGWPFLCNKNVKLIHKRVGRIKEIQAKELHIDKKHS